MVRVRARVGVRARVRVRVRRVLLALERLPGEGLAEHLVRGVGYG